jgi:hypothetical protein
MSSDEGLRRMRDQLSAIDRENTERFALLNKRSGAAAQELKESTDTQLKHAGGVLARLNERAQRANKAGGRVMNSTVEGRKDDDYAFLQFEGERGGAGTPPAPVPPVAAEPPARHRRAPAAPADEEDFAEQKWWEG